MNRKLILVIFLLVTTGSAIAEQPVAANMKPTPQMIEEAKNNPNGWIYVIKGQYGPDEKIPPQAIAGAWQVDAAGKIIEGSFRVNPNYQGNKQ